MKTYDEMDANEMACEIMTLDRIAAPQLKAILINALQRINQLEETVTDLIKVSQGALEIAAARTVATPEPADDVIMYALNTAYHFTNQILDQEDGERYEIERQLVDAASLRNLARAAIEKRKNERPFRKS